MATSYSFGGISFTVLLSGLGRSRKAEISFTHIPGGNNNYVDAGGQLERRLPYEILLASNADYASLENLVNASGTLAGPDGTSANTVLLTLDRLEWYPVSGKIRARAEFVEITA